MTEPSSRRSGYARLLDRAIRILAMRDHSEQELRRKLVAPVMSKNGPEVLVHKRLMKICISVMWVESWFPLSAPKD